MQCDEENTAYQQDAIKLEKMFPSHGKGGGGEWWVIKSRGVR